MKPLLIAVSCAALLAGCAAAPVQTSYGYDTYTTQYGYVDAMPYSYYYYDSGPVYYDYPGYYYGPGALAGPPVIFGGVRYYGKRNFHRDRDWHRDFRADNRSRNGEQSRRQGAYQPRRAATTNPQWNNRAGTPSGRTPGATNMTRDSVRRDTMHRQGGNPNVVARPANRPPAPQG